MTRLLIIITTLLSVSASARQYIQCSSADVDHFSGIVINLDGEKSTLFITNRVDGPHQVRVKIPISFVKRDDLFTTFQSIEDLRKETIETIVIPNEFIGRIAKKFGIVLLLEAKTTGRIMEEELICYSNIF